MNISPFAPSSYPKMPAIPGISLAVTETGMRYKGRPDLLLMQCAEGTSIAGVFTKNLVEASPVTWCKRALSHGRVRGIVVNAGNANACCGKPGMAVVEAVVKKATAELHCTEQEIMVASTGVIGQPLDPSFITNALPHLVATSTENAWDLAARAIMTTDTFPKMATATATIDGVTVTINGIAKGSGMIAPNMATMLAFVATDANVSPALLQSLLSKGTARTFNRITVDSDTSTNDTLLLCATSKAQHALLDKAADPRVAVFAKALETVLLDLAHAIVKDGEGASKFIAITVKGAASEEDAATVAASVANSPLVKTALAAEDANWGRIMMGIGKAGVKVDPERISLSIGPVLIAEKGAISPSYKEAEVVPFMKKPEITITIDLGIADKHATVWTCDLTHQYIDINASYRS